MVRSGGLVAFPTETVYGLGASALDANSVRKIFEAKGRPPTNPLIVHVCDAEMLAGVVADWPPLASRLADAFWPGPLTLVLRRSNEVPDIVTGGGATVAVRIPAHPVALGLIRASRTPLAAPSANRSSELSPTTAEHVLNSLDGRIDMILDAGPTTSGIESTVLDLSTETPVLLRPGPIAMSAIQAIVGSIVRRGHEVSAGPLRSPGLLARHYAPKTGLELFNRREELEVRAASMRERGIVFEKMLMGRPDHSASLMSTDPVQYAARLYAELHRLDSLKLERILIEMPPDTDEWQAVRDRLTRASHPG